jgi:chemotaxis protein histidine kinase CheA
VGLREVSEIAARIGERLEAVLDETAQSSADLIDIIASETNTMLALARLEPLPLGAHGAEAGPPAEPIAEGAEPSAGSALEGKEHQSELPPAVREAGRLFVEEGRELYNQISALLRAFPVAPQADHERLRGELGRLFHRLKGSALIVRQQDVADVADRLQRQLENAQAAGRSLEELAQEATGALGPLEAFLARAEEAPAKIAEPADVKPRTRQAVQVETEGELWEAFQLECSEILDGLEREVLALDDSPQPKDNLATVMRLVHTLKGVVNTVGLGPTGELLHVVEDFLEALLAAPIVPPMRMVASLLHEVREAVRRNFKQAREGSVEVFLPRIEARIARLMGERPAAGPSVAASAIEDGASIHSLDSARSRRSIRSADSDPDRSGEA